MADSRVVCFGELMMRLNPPGYLRLIQSESLEVSYAGGEANVAVSLANLGTPSAFVSALPANPLGDAALNSLRRYGVDVSGVRRGGGRMGIYFVERGASQRPSKVVYDRAGSAFALADALGYDWPSLLAGATWLHVTGITPALGQAAAAATRLAVQTAAGMGVTVSCDLNYRSALWSREQAGAFMGPLMEHVDLCIANEQDAADVFGVKAAGADVESGVLDPAGYADVARQLAARFGLRQVAITLRGSVSASRNTWSAMLYSAGQAYFAPTYDLAIVDRVGGGDSFAGALIHALSAGMPNQEALDFAVAASALKHSIEHDFNLVTVAEVESLAAGNVSGRVQR